jgi:hypothetical protein
MLVSLITAGHYVPISTKKYIAPCHGETFKFSIIGLYAYDGTISEYRDFKNFVNSFNGFVPNTCPDHLYTKGRLYLW